MVKMKAAIFVEPGRIVLDDKPVPDVGPLDALLRVTTTTICGTDIHILKGEYPVRKGEGLKPVGEASLLGGTAPRPAEEQTRTRKLVRIAAYGAQPEMRKMLSFCYYLTRFRAY